MTAFLWNSILCALVMVQHASCTASRRVQDPCPEGERDCQKITINGLSLDYSMRETEHEVVLDLHTDDPLMVARILALGITLSWQAVGKGSKSINYPMGLLEIRSFKSAEDLKQFWLSSNTRQNWVTRLSRLKHIARVQEGKHKTHSSIDSLSGLQADFFVREHEFHYRLTLKKTEIADPPAFSPELSIGRLVLSSRLVKRSRRPSSPFHLVAQGKIDAFESPWELRLCPLELAK